MTISIHGGESSAMVRLPLQLKIVLCTILGFETIILCLLGC
ncbi:hypothetical protein CR513_36294 [Mucuna pruriens]|uniref:Uncharacterized protein n=1 Tax=Mucuna pruriens TaxID=157652 RepID=A0A371FWZ9_MUCPR|nr:hypothetical protein CR513_36294 [Mucuna pruriens]